MALLASMVLMGAIVVAVTYGTVRPLSGEFDDYLAQVAERQRLLMEIKSSFGYGGGIHNFKNYVLRGTPKYFEWIDLDFKQLTSLFNEYRTLKGITKEESDALKTIEATANKYRQNADFIRPMVEKGNTPVEIDRMVKIDDNPAIAAFDILEKHYRALSAKHSENLSEQIGSFLINLLSIIGVMLLVVLSLGIVITRGIMHSLKRLQGTVIEVSEGNFKARTKMTGNNELAALGKTLDDMLDQRIATEEHIRRLAYYDEITGLSNRVDCHQRLDLAIKIAQRSEQKFALLFLDLDGFKDINDSLGHRAGDELLQAIGKRLQSVLRETDFIARQGGDEFCILIENITDGYPAAQMADKCLEAITQPIIIAGRELRPRASIGITLFPEDCRGREQLLQAADSAMYAAKHAGKHRYAFYTPELTTKAEERLSLEHDLRQAIGSYQFELHYQPQIALDSGRIVAVEALIRWHHPERGLVQPDQFIEIAERIGLISKIGEWVLHTACKQLLAWRRLGVPDLRMAVNISGTQFQDEQFVDTVQEVLEVAGLEPEALELEITEGVMQVTDQSIATFRRLKELGISIAIDDFGTGYSCLGSLKQLPIDCLKVDRTFLHGLLENPDDSVIIATIIGMGHALGVLVVAEGVETQEQLKYLHGIDCDLVQGYYFSKPVTADQIPELAAKNFMPKSGVRGKVA